MKAVGIVILTVIVGLTVLSVWQRGQTFLDTAGMETEKRQTDPVEQTESQPVPPRGPIAPEIVSETWLNSAPRSSADLRGKVVVVEFWTFG